MAKGCGGAVSTGDRGEAPAGHREPARHDGTATDSTIIRTACSSTWPRARPARARSQAQGSFGRFAQVLQEAEGHEQGRPLFGQLLPEARGRAPRKRATE
eukprot:5084840-Pyramimonas_sp.AAC.1